MTTKEHRKKIHTLALIGMGIFSITNFITLGFDTLWGLSLTLWFMCFIFFIISKE